MSYRHCTAGSNYYVINDDGYVYRCWGHAERAQPMGSVKDLLLERLTDTTCDVRRCRKGCDTIDATILEGEAVERGWRLANQEDDPINPSQEHFNFKINLCMACNYSCSYCISKSHEFKIEDNKDRWISPNEWVLWTEWLKRERCQKASFLVAGGEPLIYPGAQDVLVAISKMNGSNVLCTNLSTLKPLEFVTSGEFKNWFIVATAHPCNPKFEMSQFIERVSILQPMVKVEVKIVDTPDTRNYIEDLRFRCSQLGLELLVVPNAWPVENKIKWAKRL